MKDKWIWIFRQNLIETDLNPDAYSDEEILKITKGTMAPLICEEAEIEREWVFELYWEALLTMNPNEVINKDEGLVDMEAFKRRVKKNTN